MIKIYLITFVLLVSTSFAGFNARDRFGLLSWVSHFALIRDTCELIELPNSTGADVIESDIVLCYGRPLKKNDRNNEHEHNLTEKKIRFSTANELYEREIIALRPVDDNSWIGLLDSKVPIYPALLEGKNSLNGIVVFLKRQMRDLNTEDQLFSTTKQIDSYQFGKKTYYILKILDKLTTSKFLEIREKKELKVTFGADLGSMETFPEYCNDWGGSPGSITNEQGVILSLRLGYRGFDPHACVPMNIFLEPDEDYKTEIKEQIRLLKQVDKNTVIAERAQKRDQIFRWNGLKEYSSNYEYFSDWEEYLRYTTSYQYVLPFAFGAWLLGPTLYRRLFKPTPQVSIAEMIKRELAKQEPKSQGMWVEAIKSLGRRALRRMWTEVPDATESDLVNAEPQTINKDIRKKFKQDLESNTEELEASLNQAQKKASKTYLDQLKNLKGQLLKRRHQAIYKSFSKELKILLIE